MFDIKIPSISHHVDNNKKDKYYSKSKVTYIRNIYLIGSIFWILLVSCLSLHRISCVTLAIIVIPLLVFLLGYYSCSSLNREIEDEMFKANFLTIGLIIALPLLLHVSKEYTGNANQMNLIIILSLIFSLLSLLDIWIRKKWLSVTKHIRSVLQTFALTLFILALYLFFLDKTK